MIQDASFHSLSDGLAELPMPDVFKIGLKQYSIPMDLEAFSGSITYGQRMFFAQEETNDFGIILRMIDGYYYPIVTKKKWDENKSLLFGKKVLHLKVINLYPIAMHLVSLMGELSEREIKLLRRDPSQQEKAAGIDKLAKFAELTALKHLMSSMSKSREEVLLTPYNDCLVEFMLAKEQGAFAERLTEIYKKQK